LSAVAGRSLDLSAVAYLCDGIISAANSLNFDALKAVLGVEADIEEREAEERRAVEEEQRTRKEAKERAVQAEREKEMEVSARERRQQWEREEIEVRGRREAEERVRRKAEDQVQREKEEQGRRVLEDRAKKQKWEDQTRREEEDRARKEEEEEARREAKERAREVVEQVRKQADDKAKRKAEERTRKEAEEEVRREVEEKARKQAEEQKGGVEAKEQERKQAERRAANECWAPGSAASDLGSATSLLPGAGSIAAIMRAHQALDKAEAEVAMVAPRPTPLFLRAHTELELVEAKASGLALVASPSSRPTSPCSSVLPAPTSHISSLVLSRAAPSPLSSPALALSPSAVNMAALFRRRHRRMESAITSEGSSDTEKDKLGKINVGRKQVYAKRIGATSATAAKAKAKVPAWPSRQIEKQIKREKRLAVMQEAARQRDQQDARRREHLRRSHTRA
jgi:hypothetical protein